MILRVTQKPVTVAAGNFYVNYETILKVGMYLAENNNFTILAFFSDI